jgi:hypothetical protein
METGKTEQVFTFCCGGKKCPVVKITKDNVQIGEEGNLCILKTEDWESLKKKILEGKI